MFFWPLNNGVENSADNEGSGEGCVPVIANATADIKGLLKGEIGDGNEYDVETNDDEGSDGEVGNNGWFEPVQDFAPIEHTKEK